MVRKILNLTTLENKEELSLNIISEILLKAKNPYMLFTGEKDSLVMLHLISQLQHGSINLPVLHIDTTVEFSEIYKFIDKICKLWGIRLIRERNEVASRTIEIAEDKELCCRLLKTEALDKAIYKYGIDYLFLAKRVDEQREDPFFAAQGKCAFVNPLSHFSEQDAWDYTKKYNLPYCSLYKKYKNFVCYHCRPVFSSSSSDKGKDMTEDKEVTKKLKALGYL